MQVVCPSFSDERPAWVSLCVRTPSSPTGVVAHTWNLHRGVLGVQGTGESFHPQREKELKTGRGRRRARPKD